MNTNASLTRQAPQNASFYWSRYDGIWCIASNRTDISMPNHLDGVVVSVKKRNGTESFQKLGCLLARSDNRLIWSNEGQVKVPINTESKPQPTQAKPQARLRNTRVIVF